MKIVKMENRAWKGTRLVSEGIKEGSVEYCYEIGFHHPLKKFYLGEDKTYLDEKNATYGKNILYSENPVGLIREIEKRRKVKVVIKDKIIK